MTKHKELVLEINPIISKIKKNQIEEANIELEKIVIQNPKNFIAFNLLGQLQIQKKNYETSLEYLNKGLEINKNFIDLIFNKAIVLKLLNKLEESELYFSKALELNKSLPEIYYNLALVQKERSKINEAIENFKKSIELKNNYYQSYYNLANCYKIQRKFDLAINNYKQCLQINPSFSKALTNLGIVFFDLQNFNEANKCFDEVISFSPDNSEAKYNKALNLLKHGIFDEGFKLYEYRWFIGSKIFIPYPTKKKLFNNKDKDRLLIWFEQGLGDEIMFSSILNSLKDYPSKIIALCNERLKLLFARSFPHIRFIDKISLVNEDDFDSHISIGSLYQFYRKNISDFDGKKFLKAREYEDLKKSILSVKKNLKKNIGLSWRSTNKDYGDKSIDLEKVISCLNYQDYNFINLQYGDVYNEIEMVNKKFGIKIHTLADNFNDIDKLSYIISECDEIISIDNLTIQISGALGVKTKVLLKYPNDWRWLCGSNKSYWYKSMELFPQNEYNNWSSALKSLKLNSK